MYIYIYILLRYRTKAYISIYIHTYIHTYIYIYIYKSDTEIKHARMWIKASKTLCRQSLSQFASIQALLRLY